MAGAVTLSKFCQAGLPGLPGPGFAVILIKLLIMDHIELKKAATTWIEDWNTRDLDRIMEHYAEDVEFESPSVFDRWGHPDGKLKGKTALREHFKKGLDLPPDSPFELIDILAGVDGILVVYKQASGTIVADYVVPDDNHKALIVKVFAPIH